MSESAKKAKASVMSTPKDVKKTMPAHLLKGVFSASTAASSSKQESKLTKPEPNPLMYPYF